MKIGMMNKLSIRNRFVLHTIQRNIMHLAIKKRKTNNILKGWGGGSGKEPPYQVQKISLFVLINYGK